MFIASTMTSPSNTTLRSSAMSFPGPRAELLGLIQRRYRNSFIGQAYFDDMARTYSAARIAFNRSIRNDINMRVFEAVACGSMLMTNDLSDNGLAELFRDGVHLATYRDGDDLLDKLAFYLEREALRERIAAAGRAEAIAKHTYAHRMETILRRAEEALSTASMVQPLAVAANGVGERRRRGASRSERPPVRIRSGRSIAIRRVAPTYNQNRTSRSVLLRISPPRGRALVPETARRVLDIGCGAGRLGEAIKQRQQAKVSGIELDADAAAAARERLDHVWAGDIEELDLEIPPGSFDAIVCADVLEHLREPARVLERLREWLAPTAASSPASPTCGITASFGRCCKATGPMNQPGCSIGRICDSSLAARSRSSFHRAGFAIEGMWSVNGPGDDPAQRNGAGGPVQLGGLSIGGLSQSDADEFYTYQFLVRAQPLPVPDYGLTSIVIVTYNEIGFTRQCLDSIRLLTDEPYELIVVDNGSTDGSVEYLRAMGDVRLIENESNRGFPAAANQGMSVATGQAGAAAQQRRGGDNGLARPHAAGTSGRRCRSVGLVGPRSNFVSGPQQIEVGYENIAELDGFAWDFGKAQNGVIVDVNRLVGFCLLIKREVIDAIGLLDEQFGIGCFEDDDYCLRAIAAGFRAVIAGDAFRASLWKPHISGQRRRCRLAHAREPRSGSWQSGRPTAMAAHGPSTSTRRRETGPRRTAAGRAGAVRSRHRARGWAAAAARPGETPKLSLCMIVRDNASTIAACLESIRPWVDEMIVVDTGSVDETPRIVESFGAKLFHFPWCDDFSAARNESLRHATGDWLFWMDSDDTIPRRVRARAETSCRASE